MTGRGWRIAGAALLMSCGLWMGMRMYASRVPAGPAAARTAAPAVVPVPAGEASPAGPGDADPDDAALPHPKIPDRLPDFTLADRDGRPVSAATWRGKSLILNFWATWCAPCRREMPLLAALHGEWSARGVEVVGIAVDYRDKVVEFANALKIPYPVLIGEQDALDLAARLGVETPAFPFTVFTDAQGEVVTLYVGELHRAQADLILSLIESVNRNRLSLADARRSIADGLQELRARHGD